jgi:hypothetical protein
VIHPLTPEQGTARSESKEVAVGNAASPTRPRRVDRQLERMRRAHLRQTAPGGLILEDDGQPLVSITVQNSTESHWPVLW